MQSPVKLYLRVRLPDGSHPFLKAVFANNGRVRPGYAVHEGKAMRITRDNLFTSASRYRSDAERTMSISAESRKKWMEKTANSPFNNWLNRQVKNADGTLNLEKLYEVARRWHIEERYEHLNAGQIRMNIGVRLRKAVPVAEYTSSPH
jgi:hypothetical protein